MEARKTFYEILGVQQDAKGKEINQAFRELVRKNHPDRFLNPEEKAEAERLLKDITEAYNTLGKPHIRQKYDESLAAPTPTAPQQKSAQELGREMLLQAKARVKMGDHHTALTLFDHILKSDPDNPEALFQAGMIRLRNPQMRNQGVIQVERAIALAPYNASFVSEYAALLIESGQMLRAQKILETAAVEHREDPAINALMAKVHGQKPGGFTIFGKKK